MTTKQDFWTRPDGKPKGITFLVKEGACSRCRQVDMLTDYDLCSDCDDDLEWRNQWFRANPDEKTDYLADCPDRRQYVGDGSAMSTEESVFRLQQMSRNLSAWTSQIVEDMNRKAKNIEDKLQSLREAMNNDK